MSSLKIATLIRPHLSPLANWIKDIENQPIVEFRFYIIFSIIWVTVFFMFSVYDPYKHLRFFGELSSLIGGCLVAMITIPGFLYFSNRDMSRVLYASFAVIASFLLISYRMIYRFGFSKGIIKTHENRRILIVGAGLVGRNFSREIENYHGLGFEVIGYVDDDINLIKTQKDVLGNLDQTQKIIKKHNIRHLIITLPRRAHDRISYLISEVHQLPIRIWVIPDYFSLALNQAKVSEFAGFPMIDLRAPALNQYQRLTKRVFDLVICIPSLIFTLPIMGIISILIKLGINSQVQQSW
jgi:FlaA1/EpsC-like NDP-sugar epimerase